MNSIEFIYNGNNIIIQCNKDDKIKDIINKYIIKSKIDKNSVIFLYSGGIIDEELKLLEVNLKEEESIKILVVNPNNISNYKSTNKSK